MARHDELEPLNISAPPWWDAWQAWAEERDPDPGRFIEDRDPREQVHRDDLAYELAILAFEAGYEALLAEPLGSPSRLTMAQRALRLRGELRGHRARTGRVLPRKASRR